MANWVRDFLAQNLDVAALPVVQRARRSLHVGLPNGQIQAFFTGAPCHFWDEHEEWQPLDTALLWDSVHNEWYVPGLLARIRDDGLVSVAEHVQHTTRIGVLDTKTREFVSIHELSGYKVDDDRLMIETKNYHHELRLTETGLRETLTVLQQPNAATNRWLVMETLIPNRDFPDGLVDGDFDVGKLRFPIPRAWDIEGNEAPTRRYATKRNGKQYLYTGVPFSWLADAVYPVVIDPDFGGTTRDGHVKGINAIYATARFNAANHDVNLTYVQVGQHDGFTIMRTFLRFNTAAIPNDDVITQVNLKLTCIHDASDTDFDVQIVKQNWSGQDPIDVGNREAAYVGCLSGTADNNIWRNTNGMAVNTQYTSGDLSVEWPNKFGETYYSLRSSREWAGTQPSGYEFLHLAAQEHATASYRPVLTVLYGPPTTVWRCLVGVGI